jgi:hypothetical protein
MDRLFDSFGATYMSRLGGRPSLNYRRVEADAVALAFRVGELGSAEAAMVRRIFRRVEQRPETAFGVISALTHYAQIRQAYQSELRFEADAPPPAFASTPVTVSVAASAG